MSLIQKIEGAQVEVAAEDNGNVQEGPAWFWDDEKPGEGNRPDWLEAKYNKVTDQARAYKELEKKLGSLHQSAPEEYDLNDYQELMDLNSPHIADLKNRAKELRLSQDALKSLVDGFANYQKSLLPDTDKEIEKLGPNAKMRIDTINRWVSNHLSDKSIETLGRISNTADVFELFDEIRQLQAQTASRVPMNTAPQKVEVITPQMVQSKIVANYERYKSDPAFRREMEREMALACGEDE